MPELSWEERLRAAGLRVTRPRLLVAETLSILGSHHSADEVLEHLDERGTPLPRASIYNVLDALTASGIAALVMRGPGRSLYELARDCHDHFSCTRCDALLDVPAHRSGLLDHPKVADVTQVAVVYRGVCVDCA